MADQIVETLRPISTGLSGAWSAQGAASIHLATDEVTHDSDTTYARFRQVSAVEVGSDSGSSTFRVAVDSPTTFDIPAVRDAGSWKDELARWVRDAGAWKRPKAGWIRDGGVWKPALLQARITAVAKYVETIGTGSADLKLTLKDGASTIIRAGGAAAQSTSYAETTLVCTYDDVTTQEVDWSNFQIEVFGECFSDAGSTIDLHVTQLYVDLYVPA